MGVNTHSHALSFALSLAILTKKVLKIAFITRKQGNATKARHNYGIKSQPYRGYRGLRDRFFKE